MDDAESQVEISDEEEAKLIFMSNAVDRDPEDILEPQPSISEVYDDVRN